MTSEALELLARLQDLAHLGPIESIGFGDTAVGMTLLNALGIPYSSSRKASYRGVVVTARRSSNGRSNNRVNLFARVPDWSISKLPSSKALVQYAGYQDGPTTRRLYCTVRANRPNSQGLFLVVNRGRDLLEERGSDGSMLVAWSLSDLKRRLIETHPQSMWVAARQSSRGETVRFHYHFATYVAAPFCDLLPDLLDEGAVSVDHLILSENSRTVEKGPLFKIRPDNLGSLFPKPLAFDLMSARLKPL